ncbi:putative vacuolar protein sorting-associated protein [Helianthus annuus]|nr:putative vacuolar protein sorting-associated protein [Helianthus annuus]KAJ0461418.1 putative vacuolar protein sorting-associated protein [Helianthus annuus]KAJ0641842.1 putative vacuolar protein sorting-associated protein [Helianthus annuus]KAJ0645719.1 putative vacuolar protein sorting-associated protein [Helianthus annuus]KAJ0822263.1 putative vacuolar protein sorting-associated protein [Helianthus annuus]
MHSLICMIFFTFLTISLLFNGAKMVESSNRTLLHLENVSQRRRELVGIETTFKFPSPLPNWPPGGGFAGGTIDFGGLLVSQVTTFNKIWSANEGGPGNAGATFYDAASIPEGFSVLGCYSQPNNMPLFGHILVGKDVTNNPSNPTLKSPIDYTLVWSSVSLNIKNDGDGYIWFPNPPDGYKAVGYVVTSSSEKPALNRVSCVRSDLTDTLESDEWVWGPSKSLNASGFNVYSSRPTNRGVEAMGASIGGFVVQNGNGGNTLLLSCLKNLKGSLVNSMPNLNQIEALVQTYSPMVYFHPSEPYLPSSVDWFFQNGALLYHKGDESNPSPIDPNGSNLPQGGSNDDTYWLDLPKDDSSKQRVKKGDLQDASAYFHVKPMYGGLFTDIAIWLFYPFNGASRAKVEFINISLGKIGEHVGDWEHVTLRISNFNGELNRVFFAQHSWGTWVSASSLEYANGNKPVVYSSLNAHSSYPKPGLVLVGGPSGANIGLRDDTAKGGQVMDTGVRAVVVSAEYLGSVVVEPPWLNYERKWGPKIDYDLDKEINKVEKIMIGKLKNVFDKFVKSIPREVLGEEGPTGPKVKNSWAGDEMA